MIFYGYYKERERNFMVVIKGERVIFYGGYKERSSDIMWLL